MRVNAVPVLRVTVAALTGHQPLCTRLTAGPFTFTVDADEALTLADRLVDTYMTRAAVRPRAAGRGAAPGAVTGRRVRLARPGVGPNHLAPGSITPSCVGERSYSWATGGGTPGSVVLG